MKVIVFMFSYFSPDINAGFSLLFMLINTIKGPLMFTIIPLNAQ